MNICFIGPGSIAARYIKNLRCVFGRDFNITVRRSGKGYVRSKVIENVDRVIYDDADLEAKYDAIFITNPTFLHYGTLLRYHDFSDAFLSRNLCLLQGKRTRCRLQEARRNIMLQHRSAIRMLCNI